MKKNSVIFFALVCVVIGLEACTSRIFEIRDNPIERGKEAVTIDQVSAAIMNAGSGVGWKMSQASSEQIDAVYQWSKHSATVAIPFTTTHYSIIYKTSTNLKYDGNKIHKRYNKLVTNLDTAIRRELSKVTKVPQPVKQEEPTTMGSFINWLKSIGSDDSEKDMPVTTNN
jgi:hypothetical protein